MAKQMGIDFNAVNVRGETALDMAIRSNNLEFVNSIMMDSSEGVISDCHGRTPLHHAVECGDSNMVALCLYYKMDVNAGNNAGNTPLHLAVKRGDLAIIRVLCDGGAKQDLVNKDGDTPLHMAVKMIISQEIKGDLCLKIVSELLGDGALNIRNKSGKTPLYMAIESGLKDLAAGFLNVGANPNVSGPRKNTPLHCAVKSRKNELNTGVTYLSLVERLVKHGADLTAVDGDGNTPLHLAIKYNWVDFVPFLSEGAMGIQNKLGDTPLHVAAIIDLRGGVLRLRDQGVSFSMPDKNGDYPIHVAARKGALKVIPLLHDGKTLISSPNSEEDTPLHVAVKAQRGDVVRVLIKEGADCFVVDSEGRTPLEVAAEHGHLDIISVFKECKAVAKFSLKPYTGEVKKMLSTMRYSSLYEAVKNNDIEAAKRCISKRPQLVNMPSVEGNCPLHLAVKMGNIDMIHLLIHSGADLSVENDSKHTPGTLASVNKRKDIRLFMIHESYAYRGLSIPSKLSA